VIADKLAVSLNAGTYSSDGYYENNNLLDPLANRDLGTGENNGARLAVLWQPAATFSLLANVSYTENEVGPRAIVKVGNANTFYRNGTRLPAGTLPDFTFNQTGLDTPNDPSDDTGMDYGQWEGKVGSVDERGTSLSRTERDDTPFRGSRDRTWLGYVKLDWEVGPVLLKSNSSILDNDAFLNEDRSTASCRTTASSAPTSPWPTTTSTRRIPGTTRRSSRSSRTPGTGGGGCSVSPASGRTPRTVTSRLAGTTTPTSRPGSRTSASPSRPWTWRAAIATRPGLARCRRSSRATRPATPPSGSSAMT
jgi:hypothetical protein